MGELRRRCASRPMGKRWLAVSLLAAVIGTGALMGATPTAAEDTPTSTPTSAPTAAAESSLSVELTCTPETFRPEEWVVFECVSHLTNNSDTPMSDIRAVIVKAQGVIPSYFRVLYTVDGEARPQDPTDTSFGGEKALLLGQTVEVRVITLLYMSSEGDYEGEMEFTVGGQLVKTILIRYAARADAPEPPSDLLVTRELVGEPTAGEIVATATYETTITNQGSSEVTELTLTDRYGESLALVSGDPAPAGENTAVQLATWDLASLGKESLAPGESLVVRTTYGLAEGYAGCVSVDTGVMVEATVDGREQCYGARPTSYAEVGDCESAPPEPPLPPEDGGGYERQPRTVPITGPPAVPPATGFGRVDGPLVPDGDMRWAAAGLAAAGVVLVGTAVGMRRRAAAAIRVAFVGGERSTGHRAGRRRRAHGRS
jgi:hypothetical protein